MSNSNKITYQKNTQQGKIALKRRMFVFLQKANLLIKFLLFVILLLLFYTDIFLEYKVNIKNYIKSICIQEDIILKNVYIRGRKNAKISNLLNIIQKYDGQALPFIDLYNVKEEVMKDPFVDNVVVSRHFPYDIYIALIETEPVAVWKKNNKSQLVNQEGDIIESSVEKFVHLPIIMGEGANLYFYFLMRELEKYPQFKKDIVSASFIGRRRWDIYLIDNIIVNLPEHNVARALSDLITILKQHSKISLNNKVIDLRDEKKYYIK